MIIPQSSQWGAQRETRAEITELGHPRSLPPGRLMNTCAQHSILPTASYSSTDVGYAQEIILADNYRSFLLATCPYIAEEMNFALSLIVEYISFSTEISDNCRRCTVYYHHKRTHNNVC